MIIEHLDSLKIWLVQKLEPICDADPSALAKYVIALAKKDKTDLDLNALCEDQLDVFLGDDTKPFVAELFKVLKSKAYFPTTIKPIMETSVALLEADKGKKRKSFDNEEVEAEKVQKTENSIDVSKKKVVDNDKENSEGNSAIQNINNQLPTQQAISSETTIASKTGDDRLMNNLISDNLHKPAKGNSEILRKHSGHSSRRKSSKSPTRNSGTRQHRSSRRDRPRREHRDSSRERRSRKSKKKEKCRDYEEKGFCMLGEVCPYDHGYDPVEVDDRNLPQMLSLAGIPPAHNTAQLPAQSLPFLPNIVPNVRPIMSHNNPGLTINPGGLATVRVQRPHNLPSTAELPRNQVPIFRPRNSAAFINNISPTNANQSSLSTTSLKSNTNNNPDTANKLTESGEPYNPEEPLIEQTELLRKDEITNDNKNKTNLLN
jgi:RNA-binding protein 27